jgi:hypothetical protein
MQNTVQNLDRGISLAWLTVNPTESPDYRHRRFPFIHRGGFMKSRIIVGALMVVGVLGVGTFASRGGVNVSGPRQWTIVNFPTPVSVKNQIVMGPVMIVHDDQKMANGEACTTFYRFDPSRGPREEIVSFHCTPVERSVASSTTFTVANGPDGSCKRLVEYQIVGESEAHGIPVK